MGDADNRSQTPISVGVFEAYLNRMQRRQRKPKSVQNYRRAYAVFTAWCGEHSLDPLLVDEETLEDYFYQLGQTYAAYTVRGHMRAIRSAYRYAHRRGRIPSDPTVEVSLPTIPDRDPVLVPPQDLREMLLECRTARDEALWGLLALTGMRRIEVCRLAWSDVNFATATLRVYGKMDKLRQVPIHPLLAEILRDLPFRLDQHVLPNRYGGQMGESTFDYRLHRLTTHKAHSFRRTVASNLHRNGVPKDTINQMLGWAPRDVMSQFYLNVASDEMQAAILRLYADCPISLDRTLRSGT